MQDLPRSLSPFRHGVMVADVTGNLHQVGDSVILNIDDSSSAAYSSSSDCERHNRRLGIRRLDSQDIDDEYEHDGDDDDDDDDDGEDRFDYDVDGVPSEDEEELHCDDWEIRMLAAEMERLENNSASQAAASDTQEGHSGVRRRRKRSETDEVTTTATEQSEQEAEKDNARPRSSSLDQNKVSRRARGFFKALSFDRDKDRL